MTEISIPNKESSRRASVISAPSSMFLVLTLLMILGPVIFIASLLIGYRLGGVLSHPNPFAAYDSLWPGQSITNMAEYSVRLPEGYAHCYTESFGSEYPGNRATVRYGTDQAPQNMTCINNAENAVFRYIGISIRNNQIHELDLFSDVLQEDTLFLYWGAPDSITESQIGQTIYLYWDRSTYKAIATITKPYSVVNLVSITAKK